MSNTDIFTNAKILINLKIFERYPKIFFDSIKKKYANSKQIKLDIKNLISIQNNITDYERNINRLITNKDLNEKDKNVYEILTSEIKQSVIRAEQVAKIKVLQNKKHRSMIDPTKQLAKATMKIEHANTI
jgi:hypothetical protein